MNADRDRFSHHRDETEQPPVRENIHEIIVSVLIASLLVGSIPIFQLKALSNYPQRHWEIPSEATLWTPTRNPSPKPNIR
jgi:hypothetical protein